MAKKFMYVCFGMLALAGAFAVGAVTGRAAMSGTEIAVLSGSDLHHGDLLPLPIFSDGTPATQDQCQCIVSPADIPGVGGGHALCWLHCYIDGERRLYFETQFTSEDPQYTGSANYLVIARREEPASAQRSTWGSIKAQFKE
jgi:hypothetical protein